MDLGTIKKRLQRKDYYKTLHQVGLDVRKIWSNCQEYNQEGSDFHKLAGSLRKKWDDKFTKLLAECRPTASTNGHDDNDNNNNNNAARGDIATTGNKDSKKAAKNEASWSPLETTTATTTTTLANSSSLMERKSFAKSLFHMSKEDLGKLLVEVEAKCPSALTRNATEDEVEFNVDKISQSLLMELNAFIKSSTQKPLKSSSSNKKTSTTTTTTTTAATTTTTTTISGSSNNNSMSGSGNANAAPSSSNKRARTKSS